MINLMPFWKDVAIALMRDDAVSAKTISDALVIACKQNDIDPEQVVAAINEKMYPEAWVTLGG